MKKVLLTTATLLGVTAATVLATNNQRVQASETTVQETKESKSMDRSKMLHFTSMYLMFIDIVVGVKGML